jgi:hypothetical protein
LRKDATGKNFVQLTHQTITSKHTPPYCCRCGTHPQKFARNHRREVRYVVVATPELSAPAVAADAALREHVRLVHRAASHHNTIFSGSLREVIELVEAARLPPPPPPM